MPLTKVLQQTTSDCGQACLAMLLGLPLEQVWEAYGALGLRGRHGKSKPFASNGRDLVRTAQFLGFELTSQRFAGWESLTAPAILKANPDKKRNWHWIAAEPHPVHGVVILDPDLEAGCWLRNPPADTPRVSIRRYRVVGFCLQLARPLPNL